MCFDFCTLLWWSKWKSIVRSSEDHKRRKDTGIGTCKIELEQQRSVIKILPGCIYIYTDRVDGDEWNKCFWKIHIRYGLICTLVRFMRFQWIFASPPLLYIGVMFGLKEIEEMKWEKWKEREKKGNEESRKIKFCCYV